MVMAIVGEFGGKVMEKLLISGLCPLSLFYMRLTPKLISGEKRMTDEEQQRKKDQQ